MVSRRTKFLGVILDESLSWKPRFSQVAREISKSVGVIRKLSSCLTKPALSTLYYSLVYSYLQLYISVWSLTCPTHLRRIVLLQKRNGGARSKAVATLRNVAKLLFLDEIGHAKFVGIRFYSAILQNERRISSRYLEISSLLLKEERIIVLACPGFEPTHLCDP